MSMPSHKFLKFSVTIWVNFLVLFLTFLKLSLYDYSWASSGMLSIFSSVSIVFFLQVWLVNFSWPVRACWFLFYRDIVSYWVPLILILGLGSYFFTFFLFFPLWFCVYIRQNSHLCNLQRGLTAKDLESFLTLCPRSWQSVWDQSSGFVSLEFFLDHRTLIWQWPCGEPVSVISTSFHVGTFSFQRIAGSHKLDASFLTKWLDR